MTVVWPTALPQRFLVDGYSLSQPDGRLRSPMDAGPPKVRRRSSAAVRNVSAQIIVTFDAHGRFDRFWAEDTSGGVLPFLVPNPQVDDLIVTDESGATLTDESGNEVQAVDYWLVQFGESPPQTSPDGLEFRISFPLIILP